MGMGIVKRMMVVRYPYILFQAPKFKTGVMQCEGKVRRRYGSLYGKEAHFSREESLVALSIVRPPSAAGRMECPPACPSSAIKQVITYLEHFCQWATVTVLFRLVE